MKNFLLLTLPFLLFSSCQSLEQDRPGKAEKTEYQEVVTDDYELIKPLANFESVLVLFGGLPERPVDVKREFQISETARKNGIAIVFMNYNQRLWLEEFEKVELSNLLKDIFDQHDLPKTKVFFGGYSSGGNIALLISDYLIAQKAPIAPKGVFVIDSPIDLAALYRSSEKNIARNFSEPSVRESTWLIDVLGRRFGKPEESLSDYEQYSVYTTETDHTDNLQKLRNTKIRFYTEPDSLWWKENRMADADQMNAFYLKKLAEQLQRSGFEEVEYIATKNKGYRADGHRHPHSWSIVDKEELMEWMRK